MRKWTSLRLAFDAVLIAVCAALGYFAVDFKVAQLTFENLPIIIGAMMFGPLDGLLIGLVGSFLSQLLRWGLDATTVLWILPYAISGLFVGFLRKMGQFRERDRSSIGKKATGMVVLMILNCVLVTAMNTVVTVICYKYVYYMPAEAVYVALPGKLLWAVVRAIIFAVLTPLVIEGLRKAKLYQWH